MSVLWALYRAATPALGALAPWGEVLAGGAGRSAWRERLGEGPAAGGCDAWVHAASLGEAGGVPSLIAALRERRPDARFELTATTRTGRDRLAATAGGARLAPLDTPQAARRFFGRVEPRLVVLVETELWPQWLLRAAAAGVPVAVVSARLSPRSVRRYGWLGAPMRRLIGGLAAVLCQGEADAARWRAAGARTERTRVTGNLKHDALPAATADRGGARAAAGLDPERPAVVLGSVRPGEAGAIAAAWRALPAALRAEWQVVAVPRHDRATEALQREALAAGVGVASARPGGDVWLWDDRPGVLARYYAAADVAVVCGSLRPYGGHNPMEPAACGAAVVIGPHHSSQQDAVAALRAGGAASVLEGAGDLGPALAVLLADRAVREDRARRALAVVASLRGTAARTAAELARMGLWRA